MTATLKSQLTSPPVVSTASSTSDDEAATLVSTPTTSTPSGGKLSKLLSAPTIDHPDYYTHILSSSTAKPTTKPSAVVYDSALGVVEALAVKHSGSVWVFDSAKLIGLGGRAVAWEEEEEVGECKVFEVQTRAGAGTALLGYISGLSAEEAKKPVTIFAGSATLPSLLPTLQALAGSKVTVILNLGTTEINKNSLTFEDSFSTTFPLLSALPSSYSTLLGATSASIISNTTSAYSSSSSTVNVIDSTFSGRQISSLSFPAGPTFTPSFTTYGAPSTTTLIIPASAAASALIASPLTTSSQVIVLHSLAPEGLAELLTATTAEGKKTVYLLNLTESSTEQLREIVLASLYGSSGSSKSNKVMPAIRSLVLPAASSLVEFLTTSIPALTIGKAIPAVEGKTISFFTSPTSPLPSLLAQLFMASPSLRTQLAQYGSSVAGGVKSIVTLTPAGKGREEGQVIEKEAESEVVWISEPQVLKASGGAWSPIGSIKKGGIVVLSLAGFVTPSEIGSKLSAGDKKIIKERNVRVFLLPPTSTVTSPIVEEIAFLLLYTSQSKLAEGVKKVLDAFYGEEVERGLVEEAQANLEEVTEVTEWEVEEVEGVEGGKKEWEWDMLVGDDVRAQVEAEGKPERGSWALAAKHLLFREAFAFQTLEVASEGVDVDPTAEEAELEISALRPSLADKTYLVTVSENRRLTPRTYDRNVFHLAMKTTGTGLKYEVGEALGIHGWNDAGDVEDFIAWYGLDADELVSFPSPHDGGRTFETRTTFQLLQQNLDLFGKPGKSFYASLALLARSKADERTLRFIAAPEGVALFKKMSEKETVTYADVLRQFESARPSMEELVGLIPEIKPRHYSIASSQAAVGDLVELLIVTVDWTTPSGSPRFGQCTRYLADLKVGDNVTVSLKPSVMKLPPLDTQPIIMAGLGTGAAPFRAFIQHRAWQKSQGVEVGPLLYYFGSRYRSQEYLYGEEIEAYINAGIITHAGLAFSRDGLEKSYIQHKMTQDKTLLSSLLLGKGKDAAYFYLCGPTWPVPDVFEALVGSLVEEGGMERKGAEEFIEELKEEERYVLEVY